MSTATNGSNPVVESFPHIPVANTLGAWLIAVAGTFLSALLFWPIGRAALGMLNSRFHSLNGLLLHLTYRYFREYKDDRRSLKIWVRVSLLASCPVAGN